MLMKLAPKKRRNPRNFYLGIAGTVVLACVGRYYSLSAEREREVQRGQLAESLAQINKTLPRQVDAWTTFESVQLLYGDTINYRYSVDVDTKHLTEQQRATMEARTRAGLEQLACGEPSLMKAMGRLKIHQEHHYIAGARALFEVDIYAGKLKCVEGA
ncbi:hypothetical protein [uncultured Pseudomonas sp.]|uniref:hypothetical protein n=1 Tax=uncultured Pseudomonas sp. TaxID=114707 RepID=UPI0025F7E480|nr:hypothetical protein [uncultured Pseudomonas sp.]